MRYTATIEWPNGMGYTECTAEYAEAIDSRDIALSEFKGLEPKDPAYAAAYEAWQRAEWRVDRLHASGHMGKPHRFAA